jgi:hypothetical protein
LRRADLSSHVTARVLSIRDQIGDKARTFRRRQRVIKGRKKRQEGLRLAQQSPRADGGAAA